MVPMTAALFLADVRCLMSEMLHRAIAGQACRRPLFRVDFCARGCIQMKCSTFPNENSLSEEWWTMDEDKAQRVRDRAYAIWESEGRPDDRHADHWTQAEQDLEADPKVKPPPATIDGYDTAPADAAPPAKRTRKKSDAAMKEVARRAE
jgi:hypothetical protein